MAAPAHIIGGGDLAERIRLGFLGAGSWGRQNHLPAIQYVQQTCGDRCSLEITALCERDAQIAEQVSKVYGIERVYADIAPFANDTEIDAFVVIVNPKHLRHVLDQLSPRGLPIFSEKPPGFCQREAVHLATTAPNPNLVAFNRRYFPIVQQAKGMISALDDITCVSCNFLRANRHDSRDYRQGQPGAVPFVTGTAIHGINLLEYLLGPIADCRAQAYPDSQAPDYWLVDLQFASGVPGRLNILPCSGSATEWIQVHSAQRSLYIYAALYSPIDYPGRIEVHESGQLVDVIRGDDSLPRLVNHGFVDEYLDFAGAIVKGTRTRSDFCSAVNSMRIAEAIEPL